MNSPEDFYTEGQKQAVRLNRLINSQIIGGEVTSDALRQFFDAYQYGAASTMSWLINKLKLVRTTLGEKSVKIGSATPAILKNEEDLQQWLNKCFPEILTDILR